MCNVASSIQAGKSLVWRATVILGGLVESAASNWVSVLAQSSPSQPQVASKVDILGSQDRMVTFSDHINDSLSAGLVVGDSNRLSPSPTL